MWFNIFGAILIIIAIVLADRHILPILLAAVGFYCLLTFD